MNSVELNNNPESSITGFLQKILAEESKQAKASRVRMILSFVAVALLLVLVITVIITVSNVQAEVKSAVGVLQQTAASVDEVTSKLKEVDFEALESSCLELAASGTTAMEGITEALEKIDSLEDIAMETLQSGEETLAAAAETLALVNSFDIESLNSDIEKLSEILTTLSTFLSFFGNRG